METEKLRLVECKTAEDALESLCHWFYEDRISVEGCEPVKPDKMPGTYQQLLVHNEHMTEKLSAYHGQDVELHVLHNRSDGDLYSRNVLLTLPSDPEFVVEFGIMRMNLGMVRDEVRKEIEAGETPLGSILVGHDVLRRIEPRWYLKFDGDSPMASHFGRKHDSDVYGRVGIIHCNDEPAIELLEVVRDNRIDS
ncbi:MAG: hypothetical protein DHS20C16_15400 [Phycisphaerae bacterium]|nr:MAG: hypothetical protein DHS20C16_15400 [Phycisphaerae bacterium]